MDQAQCVAHPFDHVLQRRVLGNHADIPQQTPERHGTAHAPLRDNFKSAPLEESGQRAARIKDDVAVAAEAALASTEHAIHQRVVDRRLDDQESARPQYAGDGLYGAGRIVKMPDDVKHYHRIKRARVIPIVLQDTRSHVQPAMRARKFLLTVIGLHTAYAPSLASKAIRSEEHTSELQ